MVVRRMTIPLNNRTWYMKTETTKKVMMRIRFQQYCVEQLADQHKQVMFWATLVESAPHLVSQWERWLMKYKVMSFFRRQEKQHIRTVWWWQLPWRKRYWSAAVFMDRAKHPVYSLQILTEEYAVFILHPLFVEEVLYKLQASAQD